MVEAPVGGLRSGHHHLRHAARATTGSRKRQWDLRHPRRGPGDQEPRHPPDPRRQGTARHRPHRPHRHAGREPPRRSVVALRFPQPRPARQRQGVRAFIKQLASKPSPTRLRPAAPTGPPLHPAPPQDRQARHRRPARQDRDARPSAASATSRPPSTAVGRANWHATLENRRRHPAPRPRARVPHATSSKSATTRPVARATAPTTPAASGKFAPPRRDRRGNRRAQEKVLVFTQFREITEPLAELSPEVFGRPGLVLHGGTAGGQTPRNWSRSSSATTARRSSSSRSRPAARG